MYIVTRGLCLDPTPQEAFLGKLVCHTWPTYSSKRYRSLSPNKEPGIPATWRKPKRRIPYTRYFRVCVFWVCETVVGVHISVCVSLMYTNYLVPGTYFFVRVLSIECAFMRAFLGVYNVYCECARLCQHAVLSSGTTCAICTYTVSRDDPKDMHDLYIMFQPTDLDELGQADHDMSDVWSVQ